jgi:hypothetical protein
VNDIDAGAQAVEAALDLDRARIRERFEQRYTVERMAGDYLAIYRELLEDSSDGRLGRPPRRRKRASRRRAELSAGAVRS